MQEEGSRKPAQAYAQNKIINSRIKHFSHSVLLKYINTPQTVTVAKQQPQNMFTNFALRRHNTLGQN